MKRIALATYAKQPSLNEDDLLLVPALREFDVTAVPAVWDSPEVCWEEFQGVVVRSCWDYHHRLEEFLAWVTRLERAEVPLWNSPALLRWNSHKGYLRDLAARGVPIVPTRWLGRGRQVGLAQLLRDERWGDAVVKPAVSASATDTWRTSAATAGADGLPGAMGVRGHGRAPGATAQADRGCRGGHGGGAGPSAVRTGRRGRAGRSPDAYGAGADRATSVSRLGRGRHRAAGRDARRLRQSTLSQ